MPHAFVTLSGDLHRDLETGAAFVSGWLPGANATARSPQPLSALSIAQQCGGSDAFSGVSGNPCAGEACKLLIAGGGKAVLAETDELMGAESYILRRVKDVDTCVPCCGLGGRRGEVFFTQHLRFSRSRTLTPPARPPRPLLSLFTRCSARAFLGIVQGFKDRLAWHGQSAESNPSGGNNFRGLYNIGLKSLGACRSWRRRRVSSRS